jgi:(1->4)-alpha-D-glucan 1-alpha-D-glucosylmutase
MTTLSTHDTKRSEDVRARLALLSELPGEWGARVTAWRATSSAYRPPELDTNTEYLLWQTLVGAFPLDAARLTAYLEKATREAKRRTTWTAPDPAYDDAVRRFAEQVVADADLMTDVASFVERLSGGWRSNVLAQKLLALTVPGVPDVYQGCELTDLSLVDPDNRRPVDYAARQARLAALDAGAAPRDLDDEKLLVVSRTLRLRREHPEWFGAGSTYRALRAGSEHVVAFTRAERVVVAARRLAVDGVSDSEALALPAGGWRDLLTGARHAGEVPLPTLFSRLPVAVLVDAGDEVRDEA